MIAQHQIKPLQLWAGRIGHFFLVLATLVCGAAGWVFGGGSSNVVMAAVLACIFGACPWAVAYLLPFASIAARSGYKGRAFAMIVGVIIAGGMELRGELMVFAGKRQASSTEATLQNARLDDVRKDVSRLEREFEEASKVLAEQRPYGASASYDAQIVEADGLATRESSKDRGGCKAKCDAARKAAAELRAKQAIAKDRETKTEPLVERLRTELSEAKAIAATTKAGDSMSVAESETLAALWTASLNPSADAKRWADLMSGLFMAVFLLVVPTTLIYASKMDWDAAKPKRIMKPWEWLSRLRAWLKGETYVAPAIPAGNSYTVNVADNTDIWKAIDKALNGAQSKPT